MKDKPSEQLLQIAQEIAFAKALAGNDKTLRDRALRRLRKWLISKSKSEVGVTEDGFVRIWRGLFYNVWMSDKPLVQEEVVEAISNLMHCFNKFSEAQTFIMCFFQTLSETWFGLDAHRLDKYLMLVRRFLRQSFVLMESYEWKKEQLMELIASFKKAFLKAPLGLLMHVCEIYLEELAKITKGKLDEDILLELIKPFGEIMSTSSDVRLIKHIEEFIYLHLLKQSDLGIKHQIKFNAWRKLGCPEGDINVMEEVEINSEEDDTEELEKNNFSLDARAGNVDVFLAPIKFNASAIADHLSDLKKNKNTKTKARKRLTDIIHKYKTFIRGKYPLGIHKVDLADYEDEDEVIDEAAMELLEEELETYNEDKLHQKKKTKKQELAYKGKWIVTPIKENELINKKDIFRRRLSNNWEVSNIPVTSVANEDSQNNSLALSEETQTAFVTDKKVNLKKRKLSKSSKKASPNKDQFHESNRMEEIAANKKVDHFAAANDWGDMSWDDQQQNEIIIEPKRKFKLSSDLPLKIKSTQNQQSENKKSTPSSGKKVEFVLYRNSIQAEEDYKLSLKKNPVIKFNKEAQPPVGVLKSAPFSSPINPFVLSPNID
uniref:Putative nucleolar protein n=1 Tax=Triatoma dimidiata TaxID=72491 RepID=A0A0V0G569_TRIDM